MTVSELIECLKTHDQSARVVINGYEYGLKDLLPTKIKACKVVINYNVINSEYGGPHERIDFGLKCIGSSIEDAILLAR